MKATKKGKALASTKKVVPKKPDKKALAAELDAANKKAALDIQKGVVLLPGMPKLDEQQMHTLAVEVDQEVREINQHSYSDFAKLGFRLIQMEHYKLHRFINDEKGYTFESMKAWLKNAAPFSYSAGMASKAAIGKLIGFVPKEELEDLPPYAIKAMAKLPKSKRSNKKILEAAKKAGKGKKNPKGRKKFFETVAAEAPEAHIEDTEQLRISHTMRPLFTRAIALAKWLYGEDFTSEEALEFILNEFMDAPCEKEGYFGNSNAIAFAAFEEDNKQAEPVTIDGESNDEDEDSPKSGLPDGFQVVDENGNEVAEPSLAYEEEESA